MLTGLPQSLLAVGSLQYVKSVVENDTQIVAYIVVVIHDEQTVEPGTVGRCLLHWGHRLHLGHMIVRNILVHIDSVSRGIELRFLEIKNVTHQLHQLISVAGSRSKRIKVVVFQVSSVHDMVDRVGYQRKRRAYFVAYVGKEIELSLLHTLTFLVYTHAFVVVTVGHEDGRHEQNYDDTAHDEQPSLGIVAAQIIVDTTVKRVKIGALAAYFLGLEQEYVGILTCNEGRFQLRFTLKGLPVEYSHGQIHHLIAMRGIDIRGLEQPVAYLLKSSSLRCQRVNAAKQRRR